MPTFRNAHTCFWTWKSGPANVNEIDIAEAYGSHGGGLWGNFPKTNYSTHAWWDNWDDPSLNPCNLPEDVEIFNSWPNQSWYNWNFNRTFKQYEWNTYAVDWDSTRLRFYLDGNLVNTLTKYYRWLPFHTLCI